MVAGSQQSERKRGHKAVAQAVAPVVDDDESVEDPLSDHAGGDDDDPTEGAAVVPKARAKGAWLPTVGPELRVFATRPWEATAERLKKLKAEDLRALSNEWHASRGFSAPSDRKKDIIKQWCDDYGPVDDPAVASSAPVAKVRKPASTPEPPTSEGSLASTRSRRSRPATGSESKKASGGGARTSAAAVLLGAAVGSQGAILPSPGMAAILGRPQFRRTTDPPLTRAQAVLDASCPSPLFRAARDSLMSDNGRVAPSAAAIEGAPRPASAEHGGGVTPVAPAACPQGVDPDIYHELAATYDDIGSRARELVLLSRVLPPEAHVNMLGGQAQFDATAPVERVRAVQRKLLTAAGKGGTALASIRGLIAGPLSVRAYLDAKVGVSVPSFPFPSARATEYSKWRQAVSRATAKGGGRSIPAGVMSALQRGRDHAGLDIFLDAPVADHVIVQNPNAGESCSPASLYLVCFSEHEAVHAPTAAARYVNREFTIQAHHSMRKAQLDRSAKNLPEVSQQMKAPCLEVSLDKGGTVRDRSAMAASGFLGPFPWLPEHLAARATVARVAGKEPSTFPAMRCDHGHANDPYHPSATLDFTAPAADSNAAKMYTKVTARAGVSAARQRAAKITKHSRHSALSCLASRFAWRGHVQDHVGKWASSTSAKRDPAQSKGARSGRGASGRKRVMRVRYTGDAELEFQVAIRNRLVEAVRATVDIAQWRALPRESNVGVFAHVRNFTASPYYGEAAI